MEQRLLAKSAECSAHRGQLMAHPKQTANINLRIRKMKAIGQLNESSYLGAAGVGRLDGEGRISYGRFLVFLCLVFFFDFAEEFEAEAEAEGEEDGLQLIFHTPSLSRFILRIVRLKKEKVSWSC
jgi:hypothetical protein